MPKLTLDQICDFLDEQIELCHKLDPDLSDRAVLIKACNMIFDHAHRNDPEEPHGN